MPPGTGSRRASAAWALGPCPMPRHLASVRTLALPGPAEAAAAVMEVLFAFAHCYVALTVATRKDRPDNGSSAWRSDSPWRSAPSRRRHLQRHVRSGRQIGRAHV